MFFSKITLTFRRSVFPSHFVVHRVPPLRSLKLMFKNSRFDLHQSSFSRLYIKTSYSSTKANEKINKEIIEEKANLEKNESIKKKEEMIVEETGNEIKKTSCFLPVSFLLILPSIWLSLQRILQKVFLYRYIFFLICILYYFLK